MKKTLGAICLALAMGLPAMAQAGSYWVNTDKKDCKVHSPKFYTLFSTVKWTGECKDGKANGPGVLSLSGNTMEITLTDGYANGKAKVFLADEGQTYEGDVKDLLFSGKGKLTWKSGTTYVGDFVDGEIEGHGRKSYPEGDYYEGQFKKNKRNGMGRYVWPNGSSFEGPSVSNKFNGKGIWTSAKGEKFEVEYKNDNLVSKVPLKK